MSTGITSISGDDKNPSRVGITRKGPERQILALYAKTTESLRKMSDEELDKFVVGRLGKTIDALRDVAFAIVEKERRGRDLSGCDSMLLPVLRDIGHGRILAELAFMFLGRNGFTSLLAGLPFTDQRRLVDSGTFKVAVLGHDGKRSSVEVPLDMARYDQLQLAFSGGKALSLDAQHKILAAARADYSKRAGVQDPATGPIHVDVETRQCKINGRWVLASQLAAAMVKLSGDVDTAPLGAKAVTVSVKLTPEEHKRFKAQVSAAGVSVPTMVRRALKAVGMI
jgi:hypothetical protein